MDLKREDMELAFQQADFVSPAPPVLMSVVRPSNTILSGYIRGWRLPKAGTESSTRKRRNHPDSLVPGGSRFIVMGLSSPSGIVKIAQPSTKVAATTFYQSTGGKVEE